MNRYRQNCNASHDLKGKSSRQIWLIKGKAWVNVNGGFLAGSMQITDYFLMIAWLSVLWFIGSPCDWLVILPLNRWLSFQWVAHTLYWSSAFMSISSHFSHSFPVLSFLVSVITSLRNALAFTPRVLGWVKLEYWFKDLILAYLLWEALLSQNDLKCGLSLRDWCYTCRHQLPWLVNADLKSL